MLEAVGSAIQRGRQAVSHASDQWLNDRRQASRLIQRELGTDRDTASGASVPPTFGPGATAR